jgi:hypothetical protein
VTAARPPLFLKLQPPCVIPPGSSCLMCSLPCAIRSTSFHAAPRLQERQGFRTQLSHSQKKSPSSTYSRRGQHWNQDFVCTVSHFLFCISRHLGHISSTSALAVAGAPTFPQALTKSPPNLRHPLLRTRHLAFVAGRYFIYIMHRVSTPVCRSNAPLMRRFFHAPISLDTWRLSCWMAMYKSIPCLFGWR